MYQFSTKSLFLVFFLSVGVSITQAQFSLSGQIRPRAELRNGFKTPNTATNEPAFFVEQRTRLNVDYQTSQLGFYLSLQDVRIWGNTNQIYKEDPALTNVYEAWGEYRFSPRASLRVGRQALNYDNARFLGNLDWAQQGRSHDAAKFVYTDTTGFSLHAAAAFNQNVPFEPGQLSGAFYADRNNYKTMQFVWLHKDWTTAKVSLLVHNDGRQQADSTVAFRQTYGLIGQKQLGAIALDGELYYQGGRDPGDRRVDAWLMSLRASFNTALTPLTFGVDYLSGSQRSDAENRTFSPLYGTNHKFYGFMDYFYVGNNHGQEGRTVGLLDLYVRSKFKLGERSALIAQFHHFQSPTTVYAAEGAPEELSSGLGEEIDLVYNLNLTQEVNFKLGYSHLLSTDALEMLKGGTSQKGMNQWAWAMLTFSPTFFTQ